MTDHVGRELAANLLRDLGLLDVGATAFDRLEEQVERQVQASKLRLPYDWDMQKMRGRVVIQAEWKAYTRREVLEMDYGPDEMDDWVEVQRVADEDAQ